MRRTAADQGADRRIRPHLVELAPETEIAEGRPSAEKKGSFCEMIVEQAQHFEEAGLDLRRGCGEDRGRLPRDRKSTRLNSSHQIISYAVFCLKKKTKKLGRVATSALLYALQASAITSAR